MSSRVFITDDAGAYWNAFSATMDCPSIKRLLCIWHIDRAWRKKLKELIKVEVSRIDLYQKLCLIRSESNEENFKKMVVY